MSMRFLLTFSTPTSSPWGPRVAEDWPDRVEALARELRERGADWVVALLHDGVEWWPSAGPGGPPIRTRSDRLDAFARSWARHVDLVLCGHNLCGWAGELDRKSTRLNSSHANISYA